MRKNTASQVIGAQLVSKTDGSAVTTGTTTIYVTGDGGTQAAGSVGSGACTHEGNGFWTYAPAQAETNYDHIGFTFVNSSAVNATVQVYTSYPQTGDSYARLGAPAGASVSADVAAVKAVLPAALVSGRMDASVGAMASGVLTATAIASDAITAAKVAADVTTEIQSGLATASALATAQGTLDKLDDTLEDDGGTYRFTTNALAQAPTGGGSAPSAADIADAVWDEALSGHTSAGSAGKKLGDLTVALDASGVRAAVGLASANLDTQLSAIDDYLDTEVAAIKAKTDNLPASPAATGDIPSAATVASAVRTELGTELGRIDVATSTRLATASYTAPLDAAGTRSAVGLASANLDTQLGALPTAAENADAILGRNLAGGSDGGRTVKDALRSLRNKTSISAGTLTVCQEDDSTTAWTATVTTTPGDPLSAIDPA